MSMPRAGTTLIFRAASFAAARHSGQHRKGASGDPYINHPISVAEVLSLVGRVSDPELLSAALLHDTVEDTGTTLDELEGEFGTRVKNFVGEVTDDKSLPKEERKRLQILHAPDLSDGAKMLKLADKICNVRDVTNAPPGDWSLERRLKYLQWTYEVIEGCRGVNPPLDACYDAALYAGKQMLEA